MDLPLPKWESFASRAGAPSARLHFPDGRVLLLHSAEDPMREALDIPLPEIWGDVVLCVGVGYGYHLSGLRNHDRPLHIILCDCWPEALEGTSEKFKGTQHKLTKLLLPQNMSEDFSWTRGLHMQVIRHPASYRACASLYDEFLGKVFAWKRLEMPVSNSGAGVSHRVLLLHRFHFLQSELQNALESSQTPTYVLHYDEPIGGAQWESMVLKAMQEFKPTLVLSVNMKGIDAEGALIDCARRLGIPVHCWFVDDPRPIALAFPVKMFPWIQAWCWEKEYIPWLKINGFNTPRWLPLAGDPSLFTLQSGLTSPSERIVFTGSAMSSAFLDGIRGNFLFDARLSPLVEMCAEELLRGVRSNAFLLEGFPLPFKDERNRTWLECLMQHTASQKKRKKFLTPLIPEGLVCAGDPEGWKEVLGPNIKCLPDISYRNGLAAHYARCAVNVNITSCQMPSAVNQRLFDVPLAGGFLLTDSQSDQRELFQENELAVFQDSSELVEKSRWFLDHPGEREKLTKAARARILAEHTYVHRLRDIFRLQSV